MAQLARSLPSHPRVIALDPKTLGETLGDVSTLAEATGSREEGVELLAQAAARIDRVRLAVRAAPRPRVAALEWLDPVYAAGHWTPQLIELAGGEDVLGLPASPRRRSAGEVALAQPQVVVVMPCGYGAAQAHAQAREHEQELIDAGAGLIVAVNASAYFSRPGPRLIDGLELLAHILHPERLPDPPADAEALAVAQPGAQR